MISIEDTRYVSGHDPRAQLQAHIGGWLLGGWLERDYEAFLDAIEEGVKRDFTTEEVPAIMVKLEIEEVA